MKKDQLAINTVSLKVTDLEQALQAVRDAGFRKVEFALWHVREYLQAGHSIEDVRALLDRYELACIGGFECAVECFSDNIAANQQRHLENAQLLAALGATNMVVGTDGPKDAPNLGTLDELAAGVCAVADSVAGLGVNVLLEFNWSPVIKSLTTAAAVVQRTGAKNVGILFDPAHYHCTPSKFEQLTAENVALIRHVHVDDMRDKPGELSNCNDDRELPGEGILDLTALFGVIEKHGYNGNFSIEMFSDKLWALPPAEAASLMYASLLPLCERP